MRERIFYDLENTSWKKTFLLFPCNHFRNISLELPLLSKWVSKWVMSKNVFYSMINHWVMSKFCYIIKCKNKLFNDNLLSNSTNRPTLNNFYTIWLLFKPFGQMGEPILSNLAQCRSQIWANNMKILTHWVKWVKKWVMSKEKIVINHYLLTHTVALSYITPVKGIKKWLLYVTLKWSLFKVNCPFLVLSVFTVFFWAPPGGKSTHFLLLSHLLGKEASWR